jgi:hypothetical protein
VVGAFIEDSMKTALRTLIEDSLRIVLGTLVLRRIFHLFSRMFTVFTLQ